MQRMAEDRTDKMIPPSTTPMVSINMEAIPQDTKPVQSLRELEEAIQNQNYARAEKIARILGRPADEIREFRKKAIKKFIVEFRNPQGAMALAEENLFTKEDIKDLLRSILQEANQAKEGERLSVKRQFDMRTMRYLTLEEWIREYFWK
jgi:two-component sensor histidine kinase